MFPTASYKWWKNNHLNTHCGVNFQLQENAENILQENNLSPNVQMQPLVNVENEFSCDKCLKTFQKKCLKSDVWSTRRNKTLASKEGTMIRIKILKFFLSYDRNCLNVSADIPINKWKEKSKIFFCDKFFFENNFS